MSANTSNASGLERRRVYVSSKVEVRIGGIRVIKSDDSLYYLTSLGEWARIIEEDNEETGESRVTAIIICAPTTPTDPQPYVADITEASDEDALHERKHAEELMEMVGRFEGARAPDVWACVLGAGDMMACLALGSTPEEASANALEAEIGASGGEFKMTAGEVEAMQRALRARGSLRCAPATRRFVAAFHVDPTIACRVGEHSNIDLLPEALDGWDEERGIGSVLLVDRRVSTEHVDDCDIRYMLGRC